MSDLPFLLSPRSIVILGASSDYTRINGRPLKHLVDKGYAGKIYPVNPKYDEIGALRCYPSVSALPEAADLAIVALPARLVCGALRELAAAGVKAAVVFSSGFAETGEAGRALEREIALIVRETGLRVCGPNCLGLINAFDNVIATFGQYADGDTPAGPVAFVTQSGAFGTAIAALARQRRLGLGYFVNTGNEADLDFVTVMRAVLSDSRIRVGAGYIEGLKNGRALMEVADEALAAGKPLVLTKVGRTRAGARAAASHTGSLAGDDSVFAGVIRGGAIVRARNEEHMLDMVEVFANCALPAGQGLGIITQSGGAGVLMADRAEELGLAVPVLAAATQQALQAVIPGFGAAANPVDITGQFIAEPRLLRESVSIVLSDPEVHVAIVWLQLMERHVDTLVEIFEEIKANAAKPFVVCWVAAPDRALQALRQRGIAVLRGAEPAVDAVSALVTYAQTRRAWLADQQARAIMTKRLAVSSLPPGVDLARGPVATVLAAQWLNGFGVRTAPARLACDAEEAVAIAEEMGYPVVLKVESPEILHKTDVGGVRLGLRDVNAVRQAFTEVVSNSRRERPEARIDGAILQPLLRGEVELVVGLQNNPVFGLVVMAGLGGVHIEVLKDVVFRKAPVTAAEAARMLGELRSRAVLAGVRGRPAVNTSAVAELISAVSCFGVALGARLTECDLNPVLASAEAAIAVDWLVVLD